MSIPSPRWILGCIGLMAMSILLAGCQGRQEAGPRPLLAPPPDVALRSHMATWQESGGPLLLMAQTTTTSPSSTSMGTIRFRDFFSEDLWELRVDRVEYLSANEAIIHTSYLYRDLAVGQSLIRFRMLFEEGAWRLNDIEVESLPAAVVTATGIQGFVLDKNTGTPVEGALVTLFRAGTQVASTTSDAQGFYRFVDLPPGTYDLVIQRKDYQSETISGIIVE
ncbi:MAG: hypothetical protein OZSIB_3017 [Candidatus Ozemobacter sibiricus]|uniref:Carboxypeptidase regulatory-like domain-containing protein n=1 Tax=Candidatus Ozemobacter sibiricus TaxID=2268124 RepID=A0A367ZRD3_9BACT|nr:MAG: hypothetical protein OZSIB_3017 [Candidatus Ozemobacter sibiricus]